MARCKPQEVDSSREVVNSKVAKEDEAEAEDSPEIESDATSVAEWGTQLRGVPCVYRANNRSNNTEEAQEASHGGHPEQAGVVLAIEDEDRHGQPQ